MTQNILPIRIYYEDTDAGGIVYHARYVNFAERGRMEFLRDIGVDVPKLWEDGIGFVIKHIDIEYHKPAFLDQLLNLHTSILELKNTSFLLRQDIYNEAEEMVCEMRVTVVCVTSDTVKPIRVPEVIRERM